MTKFVIWKQYPNVIFHAAVDQFVFTDAMCMRAKDKFAKGLISLATFGLAQESVGKKLLHTSKGWELVVKGEHEWRFKIRECSENSPYICEIIDYYQA